jgi:rubredoxin
VVFVTLLPYQEPGDQGLTLDELHALDAAGAAIADAMRRLQKLPSTLERTPLANAVQRLEECEFWLHTVMKQTLKARAAAAASAVEVLERTEELAAAPRCPGCSWVLRRKDPLPAGAFPPEHPNRQRPELWCCDNCGRSFEACELTFPVRIGVGPK